DQPDERRVDAERPGDPGADAREDARVGITPEARQRHRRSSYGALDRDLAQPGPYVEDEDAVPRRPDHQAGVVAVGVPVEDVDGRDRGPAEHARSGAPRAALRPEDDRAGEEHEDPGYVAARPQRRPGEEDGDRDGHQAEADQLPRLLPPLAERFRGDRVRLPL